MRAGGRKDEEIRPVTITRGYLKYAEGSALIEVGETRILCAASVEERVPQFLKDSGQGWITAEYGLVPPSPPNGPLKRATPASTMKIVLATRNPHKLREITAILGDVGVEWIPYSTLADAPVLKEEGSSLRENAAAKAEDGVAFTGCVALAEDSALEVDALGRGPGVHSSRFLGEGATDDDRIQGILKQLRTYPWHGRTARFRCVVAVAQPGGPTEC